MSEHDRLDPRYRPEFQRGYKPAVNDAAEAVAEEAVVSVNHAAEEPDDDFSIVDDAGAEPDTRVPAPTAVPVWRNPYLIGLLVLGVALIAVGVDRFTWATSRLYSSFTGGTGGTTQADLVTPQVMWALAPLLAIAGVLTVLGVGFFVAWRWLPRKQDASHSPEP